MINFLNEAFIITAYAFGVVVTIIFWLIIGKALRLFFIGFKKGSKK